MNIAVVTKAPIPDGCAASSYIFNVCKIMAMCGHNITILGCRRGLKTNFALEGEIEGIRYVNYDAMSNNKIFTYLYDNYFDKYVTRKLSKLGKFDFVFLYGGTVTIAKRLIRYCHKKNTKFGHFECEWFTRDSFDDTTSPKYVNDVIGLVPFAAKKSDAAILISTLLTNYYTEQGTRSVMIPNVVDLTDEKWSVRKSDIAIDRLKLAYAGVPGVGKDELGTIIKAIELMPEDKKSKTELNIYGPDERELLAYLSTQGIFEIPCFVKCYGMQKQVEIPKRLNECHYTVLIRKSTLRANAGFSTKMVESFASGIPLIANLTGDIGAYLKDEENGIVVADETIEACCDALVFAFDKLEKNAEMRKAAFETARDNFDYRIYVKVMEEFFRFYEVN